MTCHLNKRVEKNELGILQRRIIKAKSREGNQKTQSITENERRHTNSAQNVSEYDSEEDDVSNDEQFGQKDLLNILKRETEEERIAVEEKICKEVEIEVEDEDEKDAEDTWKRNESDSRILLILCILKLQLNRRNYINCRIVAWASGCTIV